MNINYDLYKLLKYIDKPVLILGKGPSMTAEFYNVNKNKFTIISVNENALYFNSSISFFIDYEPFERSVSTIITNGSIILIPYYFNVRVSDKKSKVSKIKSLQIIKEKFPELLNNNKNQIFFFETGLGKDKHSDFIFKPNLISTSALLEILFFIRIEVVYGIGFDGGSKYSQILSKKHVSTFVNDFNNQFKIFRAIELKYKKKFIIMNKETINIYVGTTEAQMIATKVLEYSIKKNTSHNVILHPLHIASKEFDSKLQFSGSTPFSLQRLLIPVLNNKSGIAIYLDSDMLVFSDIKELIDSHIPDKVLCSCPAPPNSGRRDQYSVFTIDCSKASWDLNNILEESKKDYKSVMFDFSFEPNKIKNIDWKWNSLEYYDQSINLIHFTDMDRQPWISTSNKNKSVWLKWLKLAIKDGFITTEELKESIDRGWIRSGLLNELNHSKLNFYLIKDFFYLPPHTLERFPHFNKPIIKYILALIVQLKRLILNKYEK